MNVPPEKMAKMAGDFAKQIDAAKKLAAFVGLPKEKVGGKVYKNDDMPIIRLGAIHEFGCKFNSRGRTIVMPRRSFLRMPFEIKRKELDKGITAQFKLVAEKGLKAKVAIGRVGALAVNVSKGAFVTEGYGRWIKSRKPSGRTLIDTGTLRNAITWAVRNA